MYIDKKLAGLQAVQTLSRLNRILPPKKERTYILDFRNSAEEIQEAFSPYFNATELEDTSDPNEVYNLKARLEAAGVLSHGEIEQFVEKFLGTRNAAEERPALEGLVRPAVKRFRDLPDDGAREEFRQLLSSFRRFYSFVAQIVNLDDTDLERLHLYGSWLYRMLPDREAPEGNDVTEEMLRLAAFRLEDHGETEASLPADTEAKLRPISRFGANPYTDEEQKTLSEIIEAFNARHGTNFTEKDFLRFRQSGDEILADEDMRELLARNDPELTISQFEREFFRRMVRSFRRDNVMRNAFMQDPGCAQDGDCPRTPKGRAPGSGASSGCGVVPLDGHGCTVQHQRIAMACQRVGAGGPSVSHRQVRCTGGGRAARDAPDGLPRATAATRCPPGFEVNLHPGGMLRDTIHGLRTRRRKPEGAPRTGTSLGRDPAHQAQFCDPEDPRVTSLSRQPRDGRGGARTKPNH